MDALPSVPVTVEVKNLSLSIQQQSSLSAGRLYQSCLPKKKQHMPPVTFGGTSEVTDTDPQTDSGTLQLEELTRDKLDLASRTTRLQPPPKPTPKLAGAVSKGLSLYRDVNLTVKPKQGGRICF
jgi:hypothetical protein